ILMTAWLDDPHRPTRDLDLLGFGDPDPDAMVEAFRDICAVKADDAVVLSVESLTVDRPATNRNMAACASRPPRPWTARGCGSWSISALATRSFRALKRPSCPSSSINPHHAFAPIRARPWSPRNSERWWCSAAPTAE